MVSGLVGRTTPWAILPRDPGVCKSGRTGAGQNDIMIHYLTHSRRDPLKVLNIDFFQLEDVLGVIWVKEFFTKIY